MSITPNTDKAVVQGAIRTVNKLIRSLTEILGCVAGQQVREHNLEYCFVKPHLGWITKQF